MLRFSWRNKDIKKSEREELVCFLTRTGRGMAAKEIGKTYFIESNSDSIELSGKI